MDVAAAATTITALSALPRSRPRLLSVRMMVMVMMLLFVLLLLLLLLGVIVVVVVVVVVAGSLTMSTTLFRL
jgi:hypothetical protein